MDTVTISKKEYNSLKQKSDAYNKLVSRFYESIVIDTVEDVIEDFKETNLYSNEFLSDLEDGLRKSNYMDNKMQ